MPKDAGPWWPEPDVAVEPSNGDPPRSPTGADQQFTRALGLAGLAPFFVDVDRGVLHGSAELARMLRHGDAAFEMPLAEYRERFYHPEDADLIRSRAEPAYTGGEVARLDGRVVRDDGDVIHIHARMGPHTGPAGERLVLGVFQDVTREVRAAEELRASDARLRALVDGASVAIGVARDGVVIWVNPAYCELFGFDSPAEVIGQRIEERVPPEEQARFADIAARRARGLAVPSVYEMTGVRRDGSTFPLMSASSLVDLPDGPAAVGFIWDLTALKQAQADLALVGDVRESLRRAIHELPDHATVQSAGLILCEAIVRLPGVDAAVLFGFGHERVWRLAGAGDPHLVPDRDCFTGDGVPDLIQRESDGPWDEEGGVATEVDPWGLEWAAAGVTRAVHVPILHEGHSDGFLAIVTRDAAFATGVLGRSAAVADVCGPASALLADRLHEVRRRDVTRAGMERLLQDEAFTPVFQPIVSLRSGRTVAYEALTRFADGQRPDLCFASARDVDLGVELELATLTAAVEASRSLSGQAWLDVNVSPHALLETQRLRGILARTVHRTVVEITEHEHVGDYAALHDALRAIDPDLWLAVDDAGAGVANFTHMLNLRPDILKLDISLVRNVATDRASQALVLAIVTFARDVGCSVIAEGIETEEQLTRLAGLGVTYGQGYLLGRPTSIDSIVSGGSPSAPLDGDLMAAPHDPPAWRRRRYSAGAT